MRITTAIALSFARATKAALEEPSTKYDRRGVWVMSNFLFEKERDRVVDLIERAGRDGYNGVVISDYKLNLLSRMPKHYFDHLERV